MLVLVVIIVMTVIVVVIEMIVSMLRLKAIEDPAAPIATSGVPEDSLSIRKPETP